MLSIKLLYRCTLGLVVILCISALLAFSGKVFADSQISNLLAKEKISFPETGSPALDPLLYPGLQQYAGQPVDTGKKAKAYAEEFIWIHMMEASGGKTYAEVSAATRADPNDVELVSLQRILFEGSMLRTSLLTAYAFSVFGTIAHYATIVCLVLASGVAILAVKLRSKSIEEPALSRRK